MPWAIRLRRRSCSTTRPRTWTTISSRRSPALPTGSCSSTRRSTSCRSSPRRSRRPGSSTTSSTADCVAAGGPQGRDGLRRGVRLPDRGRDLGRGRLPRVRGRRLRARAALDGLTVLGTIGALTNGEIARGRQRRARAQPARRARGPGLVPADVRGRRQRRRPSRRRRPPGSSPRSPCCSAPGIAAAFWRGRRFGPLVVENLPVTVRASETMLGRARLYEKSRAQAARAGRPAGRRGPADREAGRPLPARDPRRDRRGDRGAHRPAADRHPETARRRRAGHRRRPGPPVG